MPFDHLVRAVREVILSLQRSGPQPSADVARLLIQEGVPEPVAVEALAAVIGWGGFDEEPGTGRLGVSATLGAAGRATGSGW